MTTCNVTEKKKKKKKEEEKLLRTAPKSSSTRRGVEEKKPVYPKPRLHAFHASHSECHQVSCNASIMFFPPPTNPNLSLSHTSVFPSPTKKRHPIPTSTSFRSSQHIKSHRCVTVFFDSSLAIPYPDFLASSPPLVEHCTFPTKAIASPDSNIHLR